MIACKQVARAVLRQHHADMSGWRRWALFVHIRLCPMCGPYHRYVVAMEKGTRRFLEHERAEDLDVAELGSDARQRMEQAVLRSCEEHD